MNINNITNIFSNQLQKSKKNNAVSPVVGIMMMLTVTIIIAAVVSGFAGGLAKTQPKPPQMLFEASLVINESPDFLDIRVISTSTNIPTKDITIQTEWKDKTNQVHITRITPNMKNMGDFTYPLGYGIKNDIGENFGNYSITGGTRMNVNESVTGAMATVLSDSWNSSTNGITEGTPVSIQFIHNPSGAIIATKEITAEE